MPLDLSGLTPLDTEGLTEATSLDITGLTPLDATGLSEVGPDEDSAIEEAGQNVVEFGKGIIPGAVGMGGTTLKGLAAVQHGGEAQGVARQLAAIERIDRGERLTPLDDPWGYSFMDPARRQKLKERLAAYQAPKLQERTLYRAGEEVSQAAKEILPAAPGYEESVGRQLGEGTGTLVTGVGASLLTGPMGAAGLFALTGAGEAVERAVQDGANEEDIIEAARLGLIPGLTDSVPVEVLTGRIPVPGGQLIKVAAPQLGRALRAVGRIGRQAFIEGVQEGGQKFLQNLIAREVYKPGQDLGEGIVPEAGIGAGVGGIAGAAREVIVGLAGRRRRAQESVPAQEPVPITPEDVASPIPTDLIAEGKAFIQEAQRGAPPVSPGIPPGAVPAETLLGTEGLIPLPEPITGPEPAPELRARAPEAVSAPAEVSAPVETMPDAEKAAEIAAAAAVAEPEPTDPQKDAGNYRKGHVGWQGLDLSIEVEKGGVRRSKADAPVQWEAVQPAHYGYIRRTEGRDGEQVDFYMGDSPGAADVFVIDQRDPDTGRFDEHKAMIGFPDRSAAIDTYVRAFSDEKGRARIGGVTAMDVDTFKRWLREGDTRRPLKYVPTETAEAVQDITRERAKEAPRDREDQAGVSGAVGVRPEPVEAQPVQEGGREAPEAGGVPQAEGQDRAPGALTAGEPAFDPTAYLGRARTYVRRRGGALTPTAVGKHLGVTPGQASRVLGALASGKDSGLIVTRSGKVQRRATRKGPVDAIAFLADRGGIRDDEGHALRTGRNLQRLVPKAGPLIRSSGMSIDEAGEALWEAGYFGPAATVPRPTESEVLDLIERAHAAPTYTPEEQERTEAARQARADDERTARARDEVKAIARDMGEPVGESEIGAIIDQMAANETGALDAVTEYVERRAIADADRMAEESGNAGYQDDQDIPFEPREADREPGARAERPEGVRGDQGERPGEPAPAEEAGRVPEAEGREAVTERTPEGEQRVIPGTERSARQAQAQREARPVLAKAEQRGTDGIELFDPDARPGRQGDLGLESGDSWQSGPVPTEFTSERLSFTGARPMDGRAPESHDRAREWLLERQAADGNEHLVLMDIATGDVVSVGTSAVSTAVYWSASARDALVDAGRRMVGHHNHPRRVPVSQKDIYQLQAPGLRWVVAHGSDGGFSAARLTPEFASRSTHLEAAFRRAYDAIVKALRPAFAAGRIDNIYVTHPEAVNRALAEAGIIEYISTYEPQSIPEVDRAISEAVEAVRGFSEEIGFQGHARTDRRTASLRLDRGMARLLEGDGAPRGRDEPPARQERSEEGRRRSARDDREEGEGGLGGLREDIPDTNESRQTRAQGFLSRGQPIDRAIRIPFDIFGGVNAKGEWEPGQKLYEKARNIIVSWRPAEEGRFGWLNGPLSAARAGLIDRYGLSPEYVGRERKRDLDERRIALRGAEILKTLKDQGVQVEEARVLQAVLTGEAVADADMAKLAVPIRQAIDELGQEAVSLGLVSPESYERNRATYLHRVYLKHEADQNALSRMITNFLTKQRKKIAGDAFKGRGMFLEVEAERALRETEAAQTAKARAAKIDLLEKRIAALHRRREVAEARGEERTAESAATFTRRRDVRGRAEVGKEQGELLGAPKAVSPTSFQKGQAREQATGLTRLRSKTERAAAMIQKIDGKIAAAQERTAVLQARLATDGVPRPKLGDKIVVLDKYAEQPARDVLTPAEAVPKIAHRVFWPAGEAIPDRLKGYSNSGTWEVRRVKGDKLTLWRDFAKREREVMGEILDARYTIGRTFTLLAHDLATGRFYKDIAENEEWSRAGEPNGKWVNGSEFNRYWNDADVQWVKVPDTAIPETGGKKRWGALAGQWVRAEIWRDLNELDIMSRPTVWSMLLTQWKLMKTARSPVVHMNNIMSNMVFMDLADVRAQDLVSGIRAYVRETQDYKEAAENGAFGADIISQEIRRDVLEPILEEMQGQIAKTGNPVLARAGLLGRIADAIWSRAKAADRNMVEMYRLEDEVFRMAMYMRRRSLGDTPEIAAQEARQQFLDYDIRAPWVNAARRTVLPFIAYTYRAAPVVARSIATRPWKLAKYFLIASVANSLAYMLAPGDEDEERRSMRDEERGYTWIGVPRMLRMPWRDAHGNPVFLDIRRWIPAGDVFDINQGHSAFSIPAPLGFGGPLALGAELFLNRSAFTGQPITNELTDTPGEKAEKIGDWAWKSWMPSAAWIPGSWYWSAIERAATGGEDPSGRQYSLPQAAASSVGIKVRSQDVEANMAQRGRDFERAENDLKAQLRRIGRQRDRGLISERKYESEVGNIERKLIDLGERRAERLR